MHSPANPIRSRPSLEESRPSRERLPSFDQLLASISRSPNALSFNTSGDTAEGRPLRPDRSSSSFQSSALSSSPRSLFDTSSARAFGISTHPVDRITPSTVEQNSSLAVRLASESAGDGRTGRFLPQDRVSTISHPPSPSSFGMMPARAYEPSDRSKPSIIEQNSSPGVAGASNGFAQTRRSKGLSLSRRVSCEHYKDRVQELKNGDDILALIDTVTPDILPPRARPHFHGRHYSTTSIPSRTDSQYVGRATKRPISLSRRSTRSSWNQGMIIDLDDHPASAHVLGSQSPLSTCDPLTPGSIVFRQDLLDDVPLTTRGREVWWIDEFNDLEQKGHGNCMTEGVKIPTLPVTQ